MLAGTLKRDIGFWGAMVQQEFRIRAMWAQLPQSAQVPMANDSANDFPKLQELKTVNIQN